MTIVMERNGRTGRGHLDAAEVKAAATGRWREVLTSVAGIPGDLLDGRNHPCPKCGGTDRFRLIDADAGAAFCNQCFRERNGDGIAAVGWMLDVDFRGALERVAEYLDLGVGDAATVTQPRIPRESRSSVTVTSGATPKNGSSPRGRIVATYDYRGAEGDLIFQAVRLDPKDFRQRRPDGNGGWSWSVKGCPAVPYRLPELLRSGPAEPVFVVEGEKDVHALGSIGLIATCNAGGAGKWKPEHAEYLRGRSVVVLPDNDPRGWRHAEQVAETLVGVAVSTKVVYLPGLPEKGDASDWIDGHGDAAEPEVIRRNLLQLVLDADEYQSDADDEQAADDAAVHEPFPIEALPEPLRSHTKAIAASVQVDPAMAALPALCAAAAAIGGSRCIRLNHDWFEPSILWAAVVAKSGEGKTPAAKFATAPSQQRDADAQQNNANLLAEYEQQKAEHAVDRKAWEKAQSKGQINEPLPDEPTPPALLRHTVSDVTIEKLAEVLADNPRGVLLVRDELAGLLGGFDRYSGGRGGAERAHYLSIHSGQAIQVDRKTGERRSLYVASPHVSIFGGVQPDLLHGVVDDDDVAAGLPARFLFAMPPRVPKRWKRPPIPERHTDAVAAAMNRLFGLEPATGDDGRPRPEVVLLDAEADRLFGEFFERHCAEGDGLHGPLAAAWPKLRASAGRLLLVIHTVRAAAGEPVDPLLAGADSTRMAITLADWFGNEARRVYGRRGENQVDRDRRELVEWIERRGGEVTVRDLTRGPRPYRKAVDAETALEGLAKVGLGRWKSLGPEQTGGRPKRIFCLATVATVTEPPETPRF